MTFVPFDGSLVVTITPLVKLRAGHWRSATRALNASPRRSRSDPFERVGQASTWRATAGNPQRSHVLFRGQRCRSIVVKAAWQTL